MTIYKSTNAALLQRYLFKKGYSWVGSGQTIKEGPYRNIIKVSDSGKMTYDMNNKLLQTYPTVPVITIDFAVYVERLF